MNPHMPRARQETPKVSGFTSARIERITAVEPDLVIGFSDLQRPLLDACAAAGLSVLWFDQRDLAGIADMVRSLGRLVHAQTQAERLVGELRSMQDIVAAAAQRLPWRPRVYFEEWDEPMICGIGWVSEIMALTGGIDVFAPQARGSAAKERIVSAEQVLAAIAERVGVPLASLGLPTNVAQAIASPRSFGFIHDADRT